MVNSANFAYTYIDVDTMRGNGLECLLILLSNHFFNFMGSELLPGLSKGTMMVSMFTSHR